MRSDNISVDDYGEKWADGCWEGSAISREARGEHLENKLQGGVSSDGSLHSSPANNIAAWLGFFIMVSCGSSGNAVQLDQSCGSSILQTVLSVTFCLISCC